MGLRFLLNKNQALEQIEKAFKDSGCSDYSSGEPRTNLERRKDLFEIHHTTILGVVPKDKAQALVNRLNEISLTSDDLNQIGFDEDVIMNEDGTKNEKYIILRLAIGRPLRK